MRGRRVIFFLYDSGSHYCKFLGLIWFLKVLNNAEQTKPVVLKSLAKYVKNDFFIYFRTHYNYQI